MKKSGILNSQLSRIIAQMGHTDKLVICDCGLPIPRNSETVDLALCENIPRFLDALRVVLDELNVEDAVVAEELLQSNKETYDSIARLLPGIKIKKLPHENFKKMLNDGSTISFVRTGEATPYANIILVSGVTFD